MKSWRGYNILDLILISTGAIVCIVSGILFCSKWYIIVNTLLALFCVFTQAKGKVITQFIGIFHFCFYIFICYTLKFYGEALVYLLVMMPLYIYGTIHWLANRQKKDNIVIVRKNLSKTEWLIFAMCCVVVSAAVYFLLKALNTSQLIINWLSFITILPAVYLLARRSKWNLVVFLVNDFVVPILWIVLVVQGDLSFIPMCIYHIFQTVYDIYGLTQWIKLEKMQQIDKV